MRTSRTLHFESISDCCPPAPNDAIQVRGHCRTGAAPVFNPGLRTAFFFGSGLPIGRFLLKRYLLSMTGMGVSSVSSRFFSHT